MIDFERDVFLSRRFEHQPMLRESSAVEWCVGPIKSNPVQRYDRSSRDEFSSSFASTETC